MVDFDGAAKGEYPQGSLILAGATLFGTATYGGTSGEGVIFKVKTNGTGFTKLTDCSTAIGSYPNGSLVLSGSTLIGTASNGGTNAVGAIIKLDTNGVGFSNLFSFSSSPHGSSPNGSLIIIGSTMYGMAGAGGSTGQGTIFKINTDGSSFVKLIDFSKEVMGSSPNGFLIDGSNIFGISNLSGIGRSMIYKSNLDGSGMTQLFVFDSDDKGINVTDLSISGSVLYGTALQGGTNSYGVLFRINTDGSGFSKIMDFALIGANPNPVIVSGNIIYGTSQYGGLYGYGSLYKINTDGSNFTTLYDFKDTLYGRYPKGKLVVSGNTLYGATESGGKGDRGMIYKINTDGTNMTALLYFDLAAKGTNPQGSLILSDNVLYGTTYNGGSSGDGVVFKVNSDGTNFLKLADLSAARGNHPWGSLIKCGDVLYGIATGGGTSNYGTMFSLNTDATGFLKLIDFDGALKGSYPGVYSLKRNGADIYGTAGGGGTYNKGVIFKYKLNPVQASGIDTVYVKNRSVSIKWKSGNGYKRVVFMKQATSGTTAPVNSTGYTAGDFGKGTQIGSTGWFCVYNGASNTAIINNLTPNRSYMIKVCEFIGDTLDLKYYAVDTTGNPKMITTIKDAQVITFPAIPDSTYGAVDYSPGATSDMGLTISYSSSDVNIATIVGGKIHIVNAGSCTIFADQPGDDTTYAAVQKSKALNILKASLSITADDQTRDYFSKSNPVLTATYSGFVYGEDSSDLTTLPTITCINNKDTTKPGTYPIVVSGATSSNYDITFHNGTLTVNPSLIKLCMVRYDIQEKRNMIVWERVTGMNIKSYKILKEKSTNVYDTLGSVSYDVAITYFIDTVTDPDIQAIKYKICAIDSSNNKSVSSYYHRSINLSKIPGSLPNQLVLIWNEYDDESNIFVPANYHIYRDNGTGTFALYTDQPAGSPSYNVNVNNVVPGEQFQIVVDRTIPCNPSLPFKAESGPYAQSLSNIVEFKASDLKVSSEIAATVFPNPFTENVTVAIALENTSDVTIEVISALGQKTAIFSYKNLSSGTQQIQLKASEMNIADGMCYLKIIAGEKTTVIKCNYIK